MALIIAKKLTPSANPVELPATITFSVDLKDDEADGGSVSHEFVLRLKDSNDLFFEDRSRSGSLVKELAFERKVPKTAKTFPFTATVTGEGADLGGFTVTLDVPGTAGTGCLVRLQ